MTVWNDFEHASHPTVQPFDRALINPASIDLRLGDQLRRVHPIWERLSPSGLPGLCAGHKLTYAAVDLLTHDEVQAYIADGVAALPKWGAAEMFSTTWFMPGEFVLCHSLETICVPDNSVGFLFSKSSTGRNGIEHLHAGLFDPGFEGQATFELHNVAPWPVQLTAGQRLMQMVLIRLELPPLRSYAQTGRYQGQTGPTPAREVR